MRRLRDIWVISRQGVSLMLRSKATWLMAMFAFLYVLVIGVAMWRTGDSVDQNRLFSATTLSFFVMIVVPLVSTYFGVASVREEISQGTLLHLLVRPISKSSIWLGKYLAAYVLSLAILGTSFFLGLALAQTLAPSAGFGRAFRLSQNLPYLQVILYGPIVYPAVGLFFGLRFRWSMVWALAFILIWEEFVSFTPPGSGARALTITDSIRTLVYHAAGEGSHIRTFLHQVSVGSSRDVEVPAAASARLTLAGFWFLALVLAKRAGSRREFLSAEKEV